MVGSSSSSACGSAEQRLREQHAHLLSALQLGHRPLVQRVGDVEALQQNRRVALGRVAVLVADDALELAEAHAVVVGQVGSWRRAARAPASALHSALVAHDHRVDDAELVEGELILPQDAELGGRTTVPRCGGSSPVSSFMNVDLPAPFGPVRP